MHLLICLTQDMAKNPQPRKPFGGGEGVLVAAEGNFAKGAQKEAVRAGERADSPHTGTIRFQAIHAHAYCICVLVTDQLPMQLSYIFPM